MNASPLIANVDRASAAAAALGEGPLWDQATQTLLWVDIDRGTLHRLHTASGRNSTVIHLDRPLSAAAIREKGGFVLAVLEGFALVEPDGSIHVIASLPPHSRQRMNDGKCDPQGRFLAGSLSLDEDRRGAAALYQLGRDKTVSVVGRDMSLSNGLGWSPDEQVLYLVDSAEGTVTAYFYDQERGTTSRPNVIIAIDPHDGAPDGLAVDEEGSLWIAICGGSSVRRYTPDGRLTGQLHVPTPLVTSCAFGGESLDRLFITTAAPTSTAPPGETTGAGDIYTAQLDVRGLQPTRYSG